jgi:hypothetical protein
VFSRTGRKDMHLRFFPKRIKAFFEKRAATLCCYRS